MCRTERVFLGAGLLVPLLVAACGGEPTVCEEEGPLLLTDELNYALSVSVDVPAVQTAEASDIEICWDGLVEDLQCHELDPAADLQTIGLVRFGTLAEEEVEAGLAADDLQQADMDGYVQYEVEEGETCAHLQDFSFFGTPLDVAAEYTEDGGTYLLLLTSSSTPGVGARMLTFLEPRSSSDNQRVDVGSGCGLIDLQVDLHSQPRLPVCTEGPWTVDWSGVTKDGQGNDFDAASIDSLLLGHYSGLDESALEEEFFDLELLADPLYTLELTGGTSAELSEAVDAGGQPFPGFTDDGLWLLALRCSRCTNPSPPFLTVLEPQSPED